MAKKVLKSIFKISMLFGFIVIFATAGASDLEMISFNTILSRGFIGLVLLVVGYIGLIVIDPAHYIGTKE